MVLDCITVGFEKPPHIYGMHTLRDEQDVEKLAQAYLRGATRAGKQTLMESSGFVDQILFILTGFN